MDGSAFCELCMICMDELESIHRWAGFLGGGAREEHGRRLARCGLPAPFQPPKGERARGRVYRRSIYVSRYTATNYRPV